MTEITVVTPENIHLVTDQKIQEQIGCFGRMWNPWEELCNGQKKCIAQARCLHRIATSSLPQEALERNAYDANHETGEMVPRLDRLAPMLTEIAAEYQTDIRAIQYAISYASNPKFGLPVIQANGTLAPSMSGPPQAGPGAGTPLPKEEDKTAPPETDDDLEQLVEELEEVAESTEPVPAPAEPAEEIAPVPAPPVEEPATAAPKKRGRPKGSKNKPKEASETVQKAVQNGDAPVRPPKAPLGGELDEFMRRFQRDLARSTIAALPMGTILERREGNLTHKVKLTKDGWEYKSKKFPTLYAVQMEIAGAREYPAQKRDDGSRPKGKTRVMADMSASRYFNLAKVIAELNVKKD